MNPYYDLEENPKDDDEMKGILKTNKDIAKIGKNINLIERHSHWRPFKIGAIISRAILALLTILKSDNRGVINRTRMYFDQIITTEISYGKRDFIIQAYNDRKDTSLIYNFFERYQNLLENKQLIILSYRLKESEVKKRFPYSKIKEIKWVEL